MTERSNIRRVAPAIGIFFGFLVWTFAVRAPFRLLDTSDDAFYVEIANLWTHGVLPYVGAFDVKPPGLFAILAGAELLLGPSLRTLQNVSILFDAIAAGALFLLARQFGSLAVGLFAAILYPILSQVITINAAYSPLCAFTTLAFLAALSPLPIATRAALAGLAIGAACSIKQTACFEAIALLAILWRAPDARTRRLGAASTFVLTASLAPLGFFTYFTVHGAAGVLFEDTVVDALRRPATEGIDFLAGILRYLVYLQRPISPLFLLAVYGLFRRRIISAAAPQVPLGALGLWFASTVLGVWAQRSLYLTYLGPTLAPLLLLAGVCAAKAMPKIAPLPVAFRLAGCGLATLVTVAINWQKDLDARVEDRAIDRAATVIKASGPRPEDRLFAINRTAWLYTASGLSPPTAFIHWEHTLCPFPGAGPRRMAEALAAAPRYIVVSDRTKRRIHCELAESWLLVDAALANYRELAHVEGDADSFDVYERRDASTPR